MNMLSTIFTLGISAWPSLSYALRHVHRPLVVSTVRRLKRAGRADPNRHDTTADSRGAGAATGALVPDEPSEPS